MQPLDTNQKNVIPITPFQVKVLGGTFNVTEIRVGAGESTEQVIASLTTTSEDRWFVMAAEETEGAEAQMDTLAIIDDNMEFQIVAQGQLQPE